MAPMPKAPSVSAPLTLSAFRAGSVSVAAGGENSDAPPSRLVIAPLGRHGARDRGAVIVDATTLDGFEARQNAAKIGMRVALDFNHNTVPGTAAFAAEPEPRRVAAWGHLQAVAGVGIVLTALEWTPSGLAAWADKSFQDISPAVFRRADGTVLAVHSAGLCQHGELDGLTIEAAAAAAQLAPFFAALSASLELEIEAPMKPHPALIALLAALGVTLAADADETATETALKAAAEKVDALPKPEAMTAAHTTEITTLAARLKVIEDAEVERQRAAIVAAAGLEGKIIPLSAETLKLTPLNVLTELVSQLKPGAVPLNRTTPNGEKAKETPEAFSAESIETFARFGLTPEQVKAAEAKSV